MCVPCRESRAHTTHGAKHAQLTKEYSLLNEFRVMTYLRYFGTVSVPKYSLLESVFIYSSLTSKTADIEIVK